MNFQFFSIKKEKLNKYIINLHYNILKIINKYLFYPLFY